MNAENLEALRAVFFDVGETLVDETTEYNAWADWLGVPRHTFSAIFGTVVSHGIDYRQVFEYFSPGFDLTTERDRRASQGVPETFGEQDLYADVRPSLTALQEMGLFVGVAGNQTLRAEGILHDLHLPVDLVVTSSTLGVEKPSPEFFAKLAAVSGFAPGEAAYVGDRLDNDIRPATAAGMSAILIRRGPWGYYYAGLPESAEAHTRIASLSELVPLLQRKP